ncbi:LOW QUALITY PROTEIN: hypothetical protein M513_09827 [Trichuris suis]|uniref:DUF7047 domain-containing protein n=1 Tax=Trichuris suis TaxID=68888 RepID=A0A085LWC9_9BILA|nr:LOW QUALITY PROTEIN: hypothetical protein M513_09827 [Trichuris suis]
MAVTQRNKGKVRPLLDFRELNSHISTLTANCDECAHKLAEWRRPATDVSSLDLRKAYLQVRIHESLSTFQTVACARPKGPGEQGSLRWSSGNELSSPPEKLARRTVFSYCGEQVGHYPVCGWLRVASAYVKREANRATEQWDVPIHNDDRIRMWLSEIASKLKREDPACGRVWADASALALCVTLEDAARLRPDARHINEAELDAVIKGVNLTLSWQADSATVYRRIEDGLSGRTRLRTKAANELIIRPRLETVLSLVEEYELNLTIALVRSADNKADGFTIVPRHWSVPNEPPVVSTCEAGDNPSTMRLIADIHHASGCPGCGAHCTLFERRIQRYRNEASATWWAPVTHVNRSTQRRPNGDTGC